MIKFGNNIIKVNGDWLDAVPSPTLPPYTLRLKYKEGTTPTFSNGTGVLVDAENNIWDLTYENSDWSSLLNGHTNLLEVLSANSTGVTDMSGMFINCSNLTSVPLFDTSNVTNMSAMFYRCISLITSPLFDTSKAIYMGNMFNGCTSLTNIPLFNTSNAKSMYDMFKNCTLLTSSIPLFDTSKVTDIHEMFANCYNVQSGALSLYQQVSTQTNPPIDYYGTFTNCGRDTTTGSAELAQIPTSWGGTGA